MSALVGGGERKWCLPPDVRVPLLTQLIDSRSETMPTQRSFNMEHAEWGFEHLS